jgi:hypothetical protein
MPNISLSVPNPLGQQEASSRLKTLLAKLKERHGEKVSDLEESWPDENHLKFGFSTFGFKISGDVNVEPDTVKLNLAIPFAAAMFKGKIEQTVREEMTKVLTRA